MIENYYSFFFFLFSFELARGKRKIFFESWDFLYLLLHLLYLFHSFTGIVVSVRLWGGGCKEIGQCQ